MVHAACWAHARRYFFQAVQLNRRDLLALGIVAEIDKLFELEAEAKAAGLGAAERLGLRTEKAEPIVEDLKERIEFASFLCFTALLRPAGEITARSDELNATMSFCRFGSAGGDFWFNHTTVRAKAQGQVAFGLAASDRLFAAGDARPIAPLKSSSDFKDCSVLNNNSTFSR